MANPIAECIRRDPAGLLGIPGPTPERGQCRLQEPQGAAGDTGPARQPDVRPGLRSTVRTNVSNSLDNAKVPPSTQRTLAQQLFGPGFRNETGRAYPGCARRPRARATRCTVRVLRPRWCGARRSRSRPSSAAESAADFEQSLQHLAGGGRISLTEELAQFSRDRQATRGRSDAAIGHGSDRGRRNGRARSQAGLATQDVLDATRGILQLATAAQTNAARRPRSLLPRSMPSTSQAPKLST